MKEKNQQKDSRKFYRNTRRDFLIQRVFKASAKMETKRLKPWQLIFRTLGYSGDLKSFQSKTSHKRQNHNRFVSTTATVKTGKQRRNVFKILQENYFHLEFCTQSNYRSSMREP